MEPPADSSYDELPYEDLAFFHTHPSNLAAVAMLCGLSPPPVAACNVLELGCGSGFNLLAMSESLPGARLVGIDLSRRQIEAGREMAARAGLANVELRIGDVAALDPALGSFDYIIAHGLLSWVPAEVREAIFRACRRHLQPAGIAYLSYNAYPGWHSRAVLLDALRFLAGREGAPQQRVRRARAALERMVAELPERDSDYARLLRREVESLQADGDAYVFHEFLEADNHPLRFGEFAALAEASGLRFVGEARYGTSVAAQRGELRRALDAQSPDLLCQEQYHDLLRNRYFRQSLLCHCDREPLRRPPPQALDALAILGRVECLAPQGDGARAFRLHDGATVRTDNPLLVAILDRLAASWPQAATVRALADAVDADLAGVEMPPGATRHAVILEGVLLGYGWGWWHLHANLPPAAPAPDERPRAAALARLCAESTPSVTNLLHMPVELEASQQAVLRRLDGRTARSQIIETLGVTPEQLERTLGELARAYLLLG